MEKFKLNNLEIKILDKTYWSEETKPNNALLPLLEQFSKEWYNNKSSDKDNMCTSYVKNYTVICKENPVLYWITIDNVDKKLWIREEDLEELKLLDNKKIILLWHVVGSTSPHGPVKDKNIADAYQVFLQYQE